MPYFIGWSIFWFGIFFIIYYFDWNDMSWKTRRNIGIIVVLVPIVFFLPYYIWGTYNLIVFDTIDHYSYNEVIHSLPILCIMYVITTVIAYLYYYEE